MSSIADTLRAEQKTGAFRNIRRGVFEFIAAPAGIHEKICNGVEKLKRGRVWCHSCGATLKVNSAECLRSGWPQCCGETMSIDSPAERKEHAA